MNDDRRNRGNPDRSLISLEQDYEVRSWCRALGCSEQDLRAAVRAVGHSAARVREYVGTGLRSRRSDAGSSRQAGLGPA